MYPSSLASPQSGSSVGAGIFRRPRSVSRGWVILFSIMLLAAFYHHYFFSRPSPTTIFLVQHITATRIVSVRDFALREPNINDNNVLVELFLTSEELSDLRSGLSESRRRADEAEGVVTAKRMTSLDVAVNASDGQRVGFERPFATKRFNAKLHMINPLQLLTDYPVAYYMSAHLRLIDVPMVTANLISLLHPLVALIGGYCFIKAVRVVPHGSVNGGAAACLSSAVVSASPSTGAAVIASSDVVSTTNGATGILSHTHHRRTTSLASLVVAASANVGGSDEYHHTEMSPLVITRNASAPSMFADRVISPVNAAPTALIVNDAAMSLSEMPQTPVTAHTPGSALMPTPKSLTTMIKVCEDARKERPAIITRAAPSLHAGAVAEGSRYVSTTMVRAGCLLFMLRNFLDSLDGVVSRLQRARDPAAAAGAAASGTSFGFNGHTVDVVTDIVGSFFVLYGVLKLLWKQEVFISRGVHNLLYRFGLRWHTTRSLLVGKIVAFCGLAIPGFIGGTWEAVMLSYANLFDVHAQVNPVIFALDNHPQVRLNQFFWALTCGDFTFSVFITTLFFGCIWECVQLYFFFGYLWVAFVVMHSSYVWHFVVLANPVAAALVAEFEGAKL